MKTQGGDILVNVSPDYLYNLYIQFLKDNLRGKEDVDTMIKDSAKFFGYTDI